jgi:aquaporin related protein
MSLNQENSTVDGNDTNMTDVNLLSMQDMQAKKKAENLAKFEHLIDEKIQKDTSPEAKKGRRKMMLRAAYGEFMCSLLFYAPIFGTIFNTQRWNNPSVQSLAIALVSGFQAIAVSFAFSSVSGAHFNSAVSFALWCTGKLSNRKAIAYVFVQLIASIFSVYICLFMFEGNFDDLVSSVTVKETSDADIWRVFSTEFFLTFFLVYVAFTVAFEEAESQKKDNMSVKTVSDSQGLTLYASTPQSKTGFAPFSIGFTIFSLSLIGGASGGAFNPGRVFGPAVVSGVYKDLWVYWLAELLGAFTASFLVHNIHKIGLQDTRLMKGGELSAKETAMSLLKSSQVVTNPLTKI